MPQVRVPAAYVRGGTSRGLFFHRRHLPADPAAWDPIFLAALGSPDPTGRQLDGLGGGISSLSKVVVVESATRADADIEYTFAQVSVERPVVEYGNNCGNLTAAVGPFAVDEGLVPASGAAATLRLFNRNTRKHVIASFPLDGREAAVAGGFELQGVAGRGAPIRLEFVDPGGAVTGRLLPTGAPRDTIDVVGVGRIDVSLVDASTAVAFVPASAAGLRGDESPSELEADAPALRRLEAIRCEAAVRMGLAPTAGAAAAAKNRPFVAVVSTPRSAGSEMHVQARAVSMGRPHRAVPLTVALCLAVAARVPGSVVHALVGEPPQPQDDLCIGHSSGVLPVGARIRREGNQWIADSVVAYRTARRLMEGAVLLPAATVTGITLP